eukprot:364337-Chlamydomonas_euryale.AAC.16
MRPLALGRVLSGLAHVALRGQLPDPGGRGGVPASRLRRPRAGEPVALVDAPMRASRPARSSLAGDDGGRNAANGSSPPQLWSPPSPPPRRPLSAAAASRSASLSAPASSTSRDGTSRNSNSRDDAPSAPTSGLGAAHSRASEGSDDSGDSTCGAGSALCWRYRSRKLVSAPSGSMLASLL